MTSPATASLRRAAPWLAMAVLPWLAACGGGGTESATVRVSGTMSYDFVPATATAGLNYAATVVRPARGVQVVAVGDDGQELAATSTGPDGGFMLTVPARTSVRLRAKARLVQAPGAGASWDFSIRDNTSAGYAQGKAALYAVQGEAFDSGSSATLVHDLHAGSGWTGEGYGQARAAAPFAILDQFYSAIQKVRAVDPAVTFPAMNAYWSVNNRPAMGDLAIGEINTSHWRTDEGIPGLYILGKEDVDTDEYDTGVVVHEWGHYFESMLSRSDSVGGPHGNGNVLDMRVAFGEAWGNALAGIVRDDAIYIDTYGPSQAQLRLVMDLDVIPDAEPRGWFNEASVQTLLYKASRAPELGFDDIYRVMTGPQKTTPVFTSLFSFATYLREGASAAGQAMLDGLLADIRTVHGDDLDVLGTKQTWPASAAQYQPMVLPFYTLLEENVPVTLCTTDYFGTEGNKLGNQRYYKMFIASAGTYKLIADKPLGEVMLLRSDVAINVNKLDVHTVSASLAPGDYVMSAMVEPMNACFSIQLTQ